MSDDPAVNLNFDTVPYFGDATFVPGPVEGSRVYDSPSQTADRVIALSLRGVRLDHQGQTHARIGETLSLTLTHGEQSLTLPARVTHIADRGFRHHTVSLVFDQLDDTQRDQLVRLMAVDHQHLLVA